MKQLGPPLQMLLQRIAECPADFLDEPCIGSRGRLPVAALVGDCLRKHGYSANGLELQSFTAMEGPHERKTLQLVALCVWLLGADWFRDAGLSGSTVLALIKDAMNELAKSSSVDKCMNDADRREEFARLSLARLGYRPEGESEAQAIDRLSALSSTERLRLLKEMQAAERRAREVRQALARKAAAESADKWTRE